MKYLGVNLSADLTWNSHVDAICNAAYRKLGYLRRNLKQATPKVKLTAYEMCVRPTLEYAAAVWDPHTLVLGDKLERIQTLAVRFIFSKYRRTVSVTELRQNANLPLLSVRRKHARLKLLYQIYFNLVRVAKDKYITPAARRSSRLNHENSILPYTARTNSYKYSFFVRTIVEWNSLSPLVFPDTPNVESFLSQIM